MTRLYIEDTEVDLTSELSQQMTFAIDDIRRIEAKATTYSKTIILPGSSKNNRVFGDIYELTRSNDVEAMAANSFYNFDPTRSASARLIVNGLLIMKGVARLLSIKRMGQGIEYEIALFGELGGFMTAVGNKKLEDLDFSDYDCIWNEATIRASWDPNTYTLSGGDIIGPFSSVIYNPPIDFIKVIFTGRIPWLRVNDEFDISGTTYNNGTYVVYDILYNAGTNTTTIIIQIDPTIVFTEEYGNVTITKSNNFGTGPVFPLIDYGVYDAPGFPLNQDFRNFRPALFVAEYMAKIISGAGFTFESEFFNQPFFNRLVIPNNDARLEKRGTAQYLLATSDDTAWQDQYSGTQILKNVIIPINFGNIFTNTSFTVNPIGTAPQGMFRYTGGSSANVKINAKLDFYVSAPLMVDIVFKLKRKRSNTTVDIAVAPGLRRGYNDRFTYTMSVNITLEPNDEINVEFEASFRQTRPPFPIGKVYATNVETYTSSISIEQDPPGWVSYAYNDPIEINKTIPKNIFQKDFFISIVKMFNLMITDDPLRDKHLIITPYIDFYNPDPTSYQDWSYKVARDKPWIIKPMSEANARLYDFKYKDDNDYYNEFYKKKWNETYGNKVFDNQLEFSKDRASVDLIFSPSVLVGYNDEDKVFPAIYKYDVNTQVKTAQGHNIRIVQINYFTGVDPWDIYNGDTVVTPEPIDDYLYCGHFNDPNIPMIDINWGVTRELFYTLPTTGQLQNNLFLLFYAPYMAEIINRDSKLLTCETYLNETDIEKLDFSRLKMIDGALFRLQKVIDWNAGELNKTELLRVINTTYLPTLVSSRFLKMTFETLSTLPTDLAGWNAYFDLPANGSPFTLYEFSGTTVYLYGGSGITIKDDLFSIESYNIKSVDDKAGCIIGVGYNSFSGCSNLTFVNMPSCTTIGAGGFGTGNTIKYFNMPNLITADNGALAGLIMTRAYFPKLTTIGPACFQGSLVSEFDLPSLISAGDSAFGFCLNMTYINIPRCISLGTTSGDDGVFLAIDSKNITAIFNTILQTNDSGNPDGDIQYLETYNTVTITYV